MREIPVGVHHTLVAGAKPAVDERLGVRGRIVLVSAHHVRRRGSRSRPSRRRATVCRGHPRRALRARALAHRAGLALARRQRVARHLMRGFRHPVGFDDRYAEHALELADHRRRQRRRRRPNEAQPALWTTSAFLRARRESPGASSARPCTSVGFTSAIQEKNLSALKPGEQHTSPPAESGASSAAMRPWMWKSGMIDEPAIVGA